MACNYIVWTFYGDRNAVATDHRRTHAMGRWFTASCDGTPGGPTVIHLTGDMPYPLVKVRSTRSSAVLIHSTRTYPFICTQRHNGHMCNSFHWEWALSHISEKCTWLYKAVSIGVFFALKRYQDSFFNYHGGSNTEYMVTYTVRIHLTQCPRRLFNFYGATVCNATHGLEWLWTA